MWKQCIKAPHSVRSTEGIRQAHTSLSKQREADDVSTGIPGVASTKGLLSGCITWNNRFGLGVQNEAGQRLIELCQENALVIANTLFQQHKRRLYTWTLADGQHRNQIDYILCSQRRRSSIQSAITSPGADCGPIMNSLLPNSDLN